MQVYNENGYRIEYMGNTPVPGFIIIMGDERATSGLRGYKFHLYKDDLFLKRHDNAGRTSDPAPEAINDAIEVLKKFMI